MADLVSRKPKLHTRDESVASEPKAIALEQKPVAEEKQPRLGATTIAHSAAPASEARAEESRPKPETNPNQVDTTASVAAETSAIAVGDGEPVSLSTLQQDEKASLGSAEAEVPKAATKVATTRRNRVASLVEPTASVRTAAEEPPAAVAGPRSLTVEMADLDSEVDALRRQLAKKLIEQNAQLRKMLARFDPR